MFARKGCHFYLDYISILYLSAAQNSKKIIKLSVKHFQNEMSLVLRKPVFGVSDQVRHKPGCTATEDGQRLEISDIGSRGTVLSV